jgi:hypothetical protein
MIGVSDRLVVVFEKQIGGCPGADSASPCGRWWVGDLATGETQGPLNSAQFEALTELRPDVREVRLGAIDSVWDSL